MEVRRVGQLGAWWAFKVGQSNKACGNAALILTVKPLDGALALLLDPPSTNETTKHSTKPLQKILSPHHVFR